MTLLILLALVVLGGSAFAQSSYMTATPHFIGGDDNWWYWEWYLEATLDDPMAPPTCLVVTQNQMWLDGVGVPMTVADNVATGHTTLTTTDDSVHHMQTRETVHWSGRRTPGGSCRNATVVLNWDKWFEHAVTTLAMKQIQGPDAGCHDVAPGVEECDYDGYPWCRNVPFGSDGEQHPDFDTRGVVNVLRTTWPTFWSTDAECFRTSTVVPWTCIALFAAEVSKSPSYPPQYCTYNP